MAIEFEGVTSKVEITAVPGVQPDVTTSDADDNMDLLTLYQTAAAHFQKDDVALPGFAQFFQQQADQHAERKGLARDAESRSETQVDAQILDALARKAAMTPKSPTPALTSLSPQEAFEKQDPEASKQAHLAKKQKGHEKHSAVGEQLKSIVYGGLDGIITTFAAVSGAAGGGLGTDVVLIIGISTLFADALSMGMGDALSTKAENEMILKERKREQWEWEHNPEDEIEEMIDIYEEKGLDRSDATQVIKLMAKNPAFFIDRMVFDELGYTVPDEDENPWIDGLVTFTSFTLFGTCPLLAYICLSTADLTEDALFYIAIAITAIMLFVLGVVKSRCTSQTWYASGFEIMVFGGFTAAVSYGLGALVETIVHT